MSPKSARRRWQSQEVKEGLAVARTLRAELGLRDDQPVPCMLTVAEEGLGLEVVLAPVPSTVSGFYMPRPSPLVVVNASHPVVRQRFTLAHEVAHHAMGHGAAPRVIDLPPPTDPDEPPNRSHYTAVRSTDKNERAANTFAAELIAPIDGVEALVPAWEDQDPLDQVVRLSSHYGLSAFAAVFKFESLGRFDKAMVGAISDRLVAGEHVGRYDELGLTALDDELQRHHDGGGGPRSSTGAANQIAQIRAEIDALV
jgi:hypothetical protein